MKKIIYFLCTGNSCRSQMAEGWGKFYLGDEWIVKSAGVEAHGLNDHAVKVMKEAGINISDQTSNTIDLEILNNATIVVTLCADADKRCPIIPTHVNKFHWGFDDPAQVEGTKEEVWLTFQRIRDEIKEKLKHFSETYV